MSNCQEHVQNQISIICVNPHICQQNRKLCVECLEQHHYEPQYSILLKKFSEIVQQKFVGFVPLDQSIKKKIQADFDLIFEKLEKRIKTIQNELDQKLHNSFKIIELKDQLYLKLRDSDVLDLTNTELNQIVEIIQDKEAIPKWQKLKSSLSKTIIEAISKSEESINSLKSQIQEFQQDRQQEYNCLTFDSLSDSIVKKKIKIKYSKDQIEYLMDGQIIRSDKIQNIQQNPDMLQNLEKICHLQWIGQYKQKNQKQGKWIANWNGENLSNVGGLYLNDGKKKGQWMELSKNFCSKSQIYEIGQYNDNQRVGIWKQVNDFQELGSGEYNEKGEKNGNWREVSDGFWDQAQVIYEGKYLNGVKIGCWNIYSTNDKLMQIGGGSYEEISSGKKIGNWIEISERFYNQPQVIYKGQYENGKKKGRWDIFYENQRIGGGQYDEEFNGNKIGYWEELSDNITKSSQITYRGKYRQGKKVGEWQIILQQQNQQIGGGFYNENGDGSKLGKWVEPSERFQVNSQVTYVGEYKNRVKVGEWNVWSELDGQNQRIGGGRYDEKGTKVGNWIEQFDGFYQDLQVTYKGNYQNGEKIGRWDIWQKQHGKQQKIGGGSYDKKGSGIKLGHWIELSDNFDKLHQVTYKGDYNNGKKVGYWEAWHDAIQIGEGEYDEDSMKVGSWIEISDKFNNEIQVVYKGAYERGNKINRWDTLNFRNVIAGGQYDSQGYGIKIGEWVEAINDYSIYYKGSYLDGKKFGSWEVFAIGYNQEKQSLQKIDEQYF